MTEAPKPVEKKIDEQSQIWKIPIDRIQPNENQPRRYFDPDALKELAASVREKGILQPIVARRLNERSFEIVAGERRWRAAQAAGLHEVPVILKKDLSDQDTLELAIIENIQRQDLSPLEEGEAYDRLLVEYSLTQQQIADRVGKDRATVANMIRLLTLPHEVKEMLRKTELSAGHAKALLAIEGSKEQIDIAKKVVNLRLSVRATERLVNQAKSAEKVKTIAAPAEINLDVSKRLLNGLATELQRLMGTKVNIDYEDSKGKISVYFYSDEELSNIVEKFKKAWEK